MNQNSKFSVRDICYAGLFAAVIAVMAQISIPMPLGVPMTMQTFAITLAAVVLGSKLSAIATLVYLLLGTDLCDTQEKVKRYDRKTVEYFGLEEKEYDYQALIREIDAKATPEMLADICRDCCWFPISACCKNICEGKYVK